MWAPSWVMPVCDDANRVRTTVFFPDVPHVGLHVLQGDRPGDVPELTPAPGTHPYTGFWNARDFPDWERGVTLLPETAVAVAVRWLAGTRARVAEVPEAFTVIAPARGSRRPPGDSLESAATPECARWRLTLDRPVTLRGTASSQLVRTKTVYVARALNGCQGSPVVEIPEPSQPTDVPHMHMTFGPDTVERVIAGALRKEAKFHIHWSRVRLVEPVWFEAAQLLR